MIDREKVYGQMTEGEKQTFDLMIKSEAKRS